jgi:ABC-type antimicrobial peptide transport system permease subunit
LKLIVGNGLRLTAIGIVIGSILALLFSRILSSSLYNVSPLDPWIYSGITLLLTLVSAAACYGPTRRALAVDPAIALRNG